MDTPDNKSVADTTFSNDPSKHAPDIREIYNFTVPQGLRVLHIDPESQKIPPKAFEGLSNSTSQNPNAHTPDIREVKSR